MDMKNGNDDSLTYKKFIDAIVNHGDKPVDISLIKSYYNYKLMADLISPDDVEYGFNVLKVLESNISDGEYQNLQNEFKEKRRLLDSRNISLRVYHHKCEGLNKYICGKIATRIVEIISNNDKPIEESFDKVLKFSEAIHMIKDYEKPDHVNFKTYYIVSYSDIYTVDIIEGFNVLEKFAEEHGILKDVSTDINYIRSKNLPKEIRKHFMVNPYRDLHEEYLNKLSQINSTEVSGTYESIFKKYTTLIDEINKEYAEKIISAMLEIASKAGMM